jgi:hypothetical protein
MPQENPANMTEEELRRNFFIAGANFFSWNSGKNTPNILLGLSERVETLQARTKEAADIVASLRDTVKEASDSSTKLAAALNKLTLALVVVGAIGLLTQAVYVAFTIWVYCHK